MSEWINDIGQEDNYEPLPDIGKQQEPDEWHLSRLGKITGSTFGKLVKSDRKGGFVLSTSQTALTLIYKIAWERLMDQGRISEGLGRLNINSQSIQHGNDYESEAILKYQELTGNKVNYTQNFVQKDEWIGGTPDAYTGKDGLIEVKCPWNGGNHLQSICEGIIYNPEYLYQIQGYLWITDRKWCDFVTYDPDLIPELQINIIRVDRDEDMIEGIQAVLEIVKQKIIKIINHEKINAHK